MTSLTETLQPGMWYRCSNNGFEFHAFVLDIDHNAKLGTFEVQDWRGTNTLTFEFATVALWYTEYIV